MEKEDMAEARIVGQVTTDVEAKQSASGISWLSFTIESIMGKYKVYNKLSAFKDMADQLQANVRKGKRIAVLASISYSKNKKTDQWGTGLVVKSFKVLDDKAGTQEALAQPKPQPEKADVPKDDDSLPF